MKRFLYILSNIILIFNPGSGFFILALLISGGWNLLFVPVLITGIVFNLKFYFWTHKEEFAKYEPWYTEHEYLGECYGVEYWKNRKTGEILEL